jgi:hypothetical protein
MNVEPRGRVTARVNCGPGQARRAAVLLPVITRGKRQYRAEWHHQVANAVEYGLIMFRTRRSRRFIPDLW